MSERRAGGPGRLQGIMRRSSSDMKAIRRQTALLERATRTLNGALPGRLHGHWQVAALSTDALIVTAESSAWATPLRAYQSALLATAGESLGVRPARLQIRLATPPPARPPRRRSATLSDETARHLESAARGMDDKRLAESLRRLASRRRGASGDG